MLTRRAFAALMAGCGLMCLFGCQGRGSSGELEGSRIRAVRYSSGGGMTGSGDSVELQRNKDGSVTLTTRSKEWHNSRETGMDYVVDASAFDRFAQIANEYDLPQASKRKMSEFQALDAPTSHLSFDLMTEDGEWDLDASFTISDDQELTDRDQEGWRAVTTALSELAAASDGVPYMEPILLTMSVDGYQYPFYLNDSPAAQDLASRGLLEVTVEDRADEKVFSLEEPLDVSDTPLATGAAGTLCYFEPENSIVVLCDDVEPREGLYELGSARYEHDVMYFSEMRTGEAYVWNNTIDE